MLGGVEASPDRQRAAVELLQANGVDLALLFGSRARGTARSDSDWDVGVIAPRGLDLLRLSAELGHALGGKVDLVDLRRAPPLLAYSALVDGQAWVDRTGSERARFGSLALRRYWDNSKLRRAQEESLRQFVVGRPSR